MKTEVIKYSKSYKNTILIVVCMASGLTPFMGTSVNIALPQIAKDFSMSAISQSWIVTSFLIAATIFQIPFGRLADMVGRKRIFMYGLLLVGLSSLACALPYGGTLLIINRAIQGLGCAMIFGTGIAILTAIFEPGERGRVLGVNAAVVYLSAALGAPLGGFLMKLWGWQSIFIITAILIFIACLGARIFIKQQWDDSRGEPFDWKGSLMYGVALFSFIYGFTILPTIPGFLCITAGVGFFLYFLYYEMKEEYPVLNVNLFFTNRLFTLSSVAALINYAATFPIAYFFSLYLQDIKGLEVQHAGLVLIVQPAIQAALSPLAGKLSDRIAPHYMASMGMAMITVVLLVIGLFISATTPIWFVMLLLFILGVGFAIFSAPNQNAIMGSVETKDYSTASATTGTMRLMGQTISMGISTLLISLFVGNVQINAGVTDQFMDAMRMGFVIFAAICGVGVYASAARKKVKVEK